jgi:hypothetical protein
MFLRCCVHDEPKRWKSWLPLVEFWYNTSYHSSLGCSPFKVLHGYDPPLITAPMIYSADNKSVEDLLNDKQLHTALIKKHLAVAQNRIKLHVDKYWTDRDF